MNLLSSKYAILLSLVLGSFASISEVRADLEGLKEMRAFEAEKKAWQDSKAITLTADQLLAGFCQGNPTDPRCEKPVASRSLDKPEGKAGAIGNTACQRAGGQAVSSCTQASSVMSSASSKVQQLNAQMSSGNSPNPTGMCQQMAGVSQQSLSELQTARATCQAAVDTCNSSCGSAVNSAQAGTGAQVDASQGNSSCMTAKAKMAGIEAVMAQMENVNTKANSCYSQVTGQPAQDQASGEAPSMPTDFGASEDDLAAAAEVPSTSSAFDNSLLTSNESYTGPTREQQEAKLSMADEAKMAALEGQSVNSSYNSGYGSLSDYEYSKKRAVDQKSGSLTPLGSGNRPAARDSLGRPTFSAQQAALAARNVNVNGGYLSGGGQPTASRPGAQMTAAQAAAYQRQANMNAALPGYKADEKVDLNRFLPNAKQLPRVGGGRGPASAGAILHGPHANMFKVINSSFVNQYSSLLPPKASTP